MNKKIQLFRAIAISAVIMIHTCPLGYFSVVVRPFFNFCVGLFLFISGYLTPIHIEKPYNFIKKRISRVLFPYIIWTILYTLISEKNISLAIMYNLLTSNACYTLYFIIVYIQLMIITPFLEKILYKNKHFKTLFLGIQPIFIILLIYIPSIIHKPLNHPFNSIFSGVWFSFYFIGLLFGNKIIQTKFSKQQLLYILSFTLLLQFAEGTLWYLYGNISTATTQIKISAMFTTITFLIISLKAIESDKFAIKSNFLYNILINIGDYSFGIFLIHPLILIILNKFPNYTLIPFPITSIVILMLSYIIIVFANKVLGNNFCKFLGFK